MTEKKITRKKFTKDEFDLLKQARQEGMNYEAIGRLMGRSGNGLIRLDKYENYEDYDKHKSKVHYRNKKLKPIEKEMVDFLRQKGIPEKNIDELVHYDEEPEEEPEEDEVEEDDSDEDIEAAVQAILKDEPTETEPSKPQLKKDIKTIILGVIAVELLSIIGLLIFKF